MEDYPIKYTVEYPERLSRGTLLLRTFFGWLYCGIPHGICLACIFFVASIITFIAWWAILFTGKYPKGMFDFVTGCYRWQNRVTGYMAILTDKYPPFNMK